MNKAKKIKECMEKYPIGYPLKYQEITDNLFYWNKIDLGIYRKHYDEVQIIDGIRCIGKKKIITVQVEGYIYDGIEQQWYPAYQTWDGWKKWEKEENK